MSHSTSSTPSHSTSSYHSSHRPFRPSATARSTRPLTTSQQDRQARNKDPYGSSDESDSDNPRVGRWDAYGNDSFANIQSRRQAAITLDNPELVMMLAQSRNDSIPATRHRLTKQMLGFITKADLDAEEAEEKAKAQALALAEAKNRELRAGGSGSGSVGPSSKKKRVSKGVGEDL